jgi:hypothetical protein
MFVDFILFARFTLEEYVAGSVVAFAVCVGYLFAMPTQGWVFFTS